MHGFVKRAPAVLVGLIVVALFTGPLLEEDSILVLRDVPNFHLPLRLAFADLAREGLPSWNPAIHGGQPILSNPNYAAFYPPTWLFLVVGVERAIAWLMVLHALFGFTGAWLAARRFGCQPACATLSAVAFVAGGSIWSALNLFCAVSWLPWALYWGHRRLVSGGRDRPGRHSALTGLALAMQVLAGEPAIALASSVAIACLALTAPGGWSRRLRGLGAVAGFAILLSAVQMLPTLDRLRGSERTELSLESATTWSTSPMRLLELALPRIYGDPMRLDEDLYFGWTLNDLNFPYLISIYTGQLALLLAFAAWVRWPIPLRLFWATLALVGVALALGRYNPLYLELAPSLPLFSLLRYPEKFLILTTTAIAFSAGLGWQHLLDRRARGGPAREDLPLTIACAIAAVSLVLCLALEAQPGLAEWFVRDNTIYPPQGERLAAATAYIEQQAWLAFGLSLSSILVLALHRIRAVPRLALIPLTLLVLGSDLVTHNRGLTPTIPKDELEQPPAHLGDVDPAGGRVFTDEPFVGKDAFVPRSDRPGPDALWASVNRAEPYLGLLWGYSYALHIDFDGMLTEPAQRTFDLLAERWADPDSSRRILAAWGVGYVLRNRPVSDLTRARQAGEPLPAVAVEGMAWRSPLLTWERAVSWHDTPADAEEAAKLDNLRNARWIGRSSSGASAGGAPESISRLEARSSSTVLEYSSSSTLFAVLNRTFDRGWRARLDELEIPVHRTVMGQIGLELPPGHHVLDLRYETPLLRAGLAVSLLTALFILGAELLRRRSALEARE